MQTFISRLNYATINMSVQNGCIEMYILHFTVYLLLQALLYVYLAKTVLAVTLIKGSVK